jgi:YYY domain-containing protein
VLIIIVWWLWMGVIGLAALPLCYRFFRRLPGRGYAFARPLGLLLTSYVLWMGASLGLLRNTLGGVLFSLLVIVAISVLAYQRGRTEGDPGLWAWLRANGRLVLAVELLFAGALALWSLLRAYSPDLMTAGGEKFMEIMYLNSIGRSQYFPPHDAWLGGYAISYYYFGYVMMAALTRLSGFAAHLTFNVGVALLFALTCTGAFGVVYNLVKGVVLRSDRPGEPAARPIAYGFLGAILVAVLGNLEGLLEVLYSARFLPERFWSWLDIVELNQPFDPGGAASLMPTRSGWWWWRASRVIHDLDPAGNSMGIQPIDEFPGFSFLLGDMHPHVLALPFVLLVLAVALRALLEASGRREPNEEREGIKAWLAPVLRISPLVPLCLGALGFLNTWDFPIYLVVFAAAYGLGRWGYYSRLSGPFLRDVGVTGVAVAFSGFVLYLPFYVGFQSQAGGLLPTLYVGTRFRHYFVMFGPFLVAIAGMLAVLALRLKRHMPGRRLFGRWAWWTAAFILVPLGVMLLIVVLMLLMPQGREFLEGIRRVPFVQELVGDGPWPGVVGNLLLVKLRTWVMPLVVAGMAGMCAVLLVPRSATETESGSQGEFLSDSSVRFALICAIFGLLLTLSVEFVYLVDVFRMRMNTIFKFYFQAWILMALASAFAVYWLGRKRDWLRLAFLAVFWLLFAMGMVYPVFGNAARAGMFDHPPRLDGTAYLAESKPDDYAAITWLNEHVDGTPLILESPGSGGSSYVYEGRVSALTGLPTLLGWAGHEGQWRGSYTIQEARDPDIKTIYNTLDLDAAERLLDSYGVTYVYVGPVERGTYDARALDKFRRFMDVVYEEDGVTIYKARN